eukprot:COSAG05_NODE_4574_length_1455_cov_203.519912_2_plen_174_part_00
MFFDGTAKKAGRARKAQPSGDAKKRLLQQAREERQERSRLKLRTVSARTVQAAVRSFLARRSTRQSVRDEWDRDAGAAAATATIADPKQMLGRFLFFYTRDVDVDRVNLMVRLVISLVVDGALAAAAPCIAVGTIDSFDAQVDSSGSSQSWRRARHAMWSCCCGALPACAFLD